MGDEQKMPINNSLRKITLKYHAYQHIKVGAAIGGDVRRGLEEQSLIRNLPGAAVPNIV